MVAFPSLRKNTKAWASRLKGGLHGPLFFGLQMRDNKHAIVFSSDKNWLPHTRVFIEQLQKLRLPDIDLIYCTSESEQIDLPKPVIVERIKNIGEERELSAITRIPRAAYLRMSMPTHFRGRYKKLLYLDVDIAFFRRNLKEVFNIELLDQHAIAAVRVNRQWLDPSRMLPDFKESGLGPAPSFNSGVMLIDPEKWYQFSVDARIEHILNTQGEHFYDVDQSVLNLAMRGLWSEISPVWNWMYQQKRGFNAFRYGAEVIHFAGKQKPWERNKFIPNRFVKPYFKLFEENVELARKLPKLHSPREEMKMLYGLYQESREDQAKIREYIKRFERRTSSLNPEIYGQYSALT
ncbi:MAG: glycosyltransferase [Pseudomonadota bacterium]